MPTLAELELEYERAIACGKTELALGAIDDMIAQWPTRIGLRELAERRAVLKHEESRAKLGRFGWILPRKVGA